jgi:hypothetical protein
MITQPTIRVGASIDRYLEAHGALAQAYDRQTVFASSRISSLCRLDKRMLLLHELAHLQQLATPGSDPERALEEEAWEAAHAWAEGRRFRIRGRACARLNATAIIQGGKAGHPDAPPWYVGNPLEPVGGQSTIEIKKTVVLETLSIDSLLDQIIASKESEILIVNHGNTDGLMTTLFDDSTSLIAKDMISFLSMDKPSTAQDGLGGSYKLPVKSDSEVAIIAKTTESRVAALRKKMNAVRAMKLQHVAFRACDMGDDSDTMQVYRSFFGAKSISAPTEFDTYGHFTIGSGDINQWATQKLKTGFNVWIDGGVAFATSKHYTGLTYQIESKGSSRDANNRWIKTHISDHVDPNRVIFHGIKTVVMTQTDQNVFFVKDAGYKSRIASYPP